MRKHASAKKIKNLIDDNPRCYIAAKKLIEQVEDKFLLGDRLELYFVRRGIVGSNNEVNWDDVVDFVYEKFRGGAGKDLAKESKKAAQEDLLEDEDILEGPESDSQLLWPGTVAPIEPGDKAKFQGLDGPIRGKIVELDPEANTLIIESKGLQYRVVVDEVEVLPSTMKKMWKA